MGKDGPFYGFLPFLQAGADSTAAAVFGNVSRGAGLSPF